MPFTIILPSLQSILSTDFLIESRYDIMDNFNTHNTYATVGIAGLIQQADASQINIGDGFGAITPAALSGASFNYPMKYDNGVVTSGVVAGYGGNFASVDYVDAVAAGAVNLQDFLDNQIAPFYLKKSETDVPTADNLYDLGSSGAKWANIYATTFQGTASQAQYGDLAEKYTCLDSDLEVGDLISVYVGDEDVDTQKTTSECDPRIIGVVSEKPAFLMSKEIDGPVVGLVGKVPVKVIGKCSKGDILVSSDVAGVARVATSPAEYACKIGYTVASSDDENVKLVSSIIK